MEDVDSVVELEAEAGCLTVGLGGVWMWVWGWELGRLELPNNSPSLVMRRAVWIPSPVIRDSRGGMRLDRNIEYV